MGVIYSWMQKRIGLLLSGIELWARKILSWMGNIASFEMCASKQSFDLTSKTR